MQFDEHIGVGQDHKNSHVLVPLLRRFENGDGEQLACLALVSNKIRITNKNVLERLAG